MTLTSRFEEALVYAHRIHLGQVRRKTNMPMIAHLLGVASIVLEYGGNEDEAIAALLHDAVEEAGGPQRLDDIRRRFGPAIADVVMGCTDSDQFPRPPWRARKELYLAHLPHASHSVRLVSASDKLHNARALLRTYRLLGEVIWERYNEGKEGTLWYYRALALAFNADGASALTQELDRVVTEIERLPNSPSPTASTPAL